MAALPAPRIKGVETEIGGVVYTVPPLSFGAIERFQDSLGKPTPSVVVDVAHAALSRNYPTMTREDVAEIIDTENCERVFAAIMASSKLEPVAGEARPAGPRRRGTGGKSTRT